jgi:hypothetical protein
MRAHTSCQQTVVSILYPDRLDGVEAIRSVPGVMGSQLYRCLSGGKTSLKLEVSRIGNYTKSGWQG